MLDFGNSQCRNIPQHGAVKMTGTEPHHSSAKEPMYETRIRDGKHSFLPDSVFIWRGIASVLIQGQALVSVISRPCCGGNAYYVVVRGPCLLWPWGLFPWSSRAPRKRDHRNRPGKEKKKNLDPSTVELCIFSHLLVSPIQTLSHCCRVFVTYYSVSISLSTS